MGSFPGIPPGTWSLDLWKLVLGYSVLRTMTILLDGENRKPAGPITSIIVNESDAIVCADVSEMRGGSLDGHKTRRKSPHLPRFLPEYLKIHDGLPVRILQVYPLLRHPTLIHSSTD